MAERIKINSELRELNRMIQEVEARLARSPDYITLRALERARDEIEAQYHERVVDHDTGAELALVPTGRQFKKGGPSQLDAAAQALEQAGEPLTTPEMVNRVRLLGAKVGGAKPNINLSSSLSKSEDFQNVKWKGETAWWLANRPLPNAEPFRLAAE